jgi:hypothetical protein
MWTTQIQQTHKNSNTHAKYIFDILFTLFFLALYLLLFFMFLDDGAMQHMWTADPFSFNCTIVLFPSIAPSKSSSFVDVLERNMHAHVVLINNNCTSSCFVVSHSCNIWCFTHFDTWCNFRPLSCLRGCKFWVVMILLETKHHGRWSNTDNIVMISSHEMVVGNDPQSCGVLINVNYQRKRTSMFLYLNLRNCWRK